jgi:hypothetical protein
MYLIYTPPKGNTQGVVHLSTDGQVEDCATKPAGYREQGGVVGEPKTEDLMAARIESREFRKCRKCWKYGPQWGGR